MKLRRSSFPTSVTAGCAVGLSIAACGVSVEISTETSGAGGAGSTTGTFTTTSTSSGVTTSSSTSSSSGSPTCGSGGPLVGPCAPSAVCKGAATPCLSAVDQAGSPTPGLRMAQLSFSQPKVFTTGIVANVLQGSVLPNDPGCNLAGSATFSWLLRFDIPAGTLTIGGSKPALSSVGLYSFVDQMIPMGGVTFHVQPVKLMAPLLDGCNFESSAGDVVIPLYLDAAGTQAILLPLRSVRFTSGILSSNGTCIGRYNAEGLEPINACLPDSQTEAFLPGGKVSAFMTLEEADLVVISSLSQTLCVLLSGDAAQYGTTNSLGVTVCKRDAANVIVFKGDWCGASDQPASGGCADAVKVLASFAAQGVKIQ